MNMVDTLVLTGRTEIICLYNTLWVNFLIILQNYLALKLPVIRSSTVQMLWLLDLQSANVPIFKENSNYLDVQALIGVYCRW